jgi:hypothetical protein
MATFLFKAITKNPQTGEVLALPPGAVDSFVINGPNGAGMAEVYAFARASGFGNRGVKYVVATVVPGEWEVLCVQPYIGMSAQQPVMSAQHVNGGQPSGNPYGQPGQNRATMPPDSSGFQNIGDDALSAAPDGGMMGGDDALQGTVSDLYGGGHQEVQRQM